MQRSMGQSSTEFLFIIAILFVVIIVFFVLSQNQFSSINSTRMEQQGKNVVDIIANAAKEVYNQGEGARKRVYVDIPTSYDYSNSSITNRTISMRVLGSDFARTLDFDVNGKLPITSGSQWIWLISQNNSVTISSSLISVSKNSIVKIMLQNTIITDSLSIQDVSNTPINVSINLTWNNPSISVILSAANFTLSPQTSNTIILTFNSNSAPIGYYFGNLVITGVSGSSSDAITVPITIQIVQAGGQAPPLFIVPNYWSESVLPGNNLTKLFDVCTSPGNSVTGVDFTTNGTAGTWVGGLSSLPAMASDTCIPTILTLTIPLNTSGGNYTGTIIANGLGITNAQDTINMWINVGSTQGDIIGPLVKNISRNPKRLFSGDSVNISAICDDTSRGNDNIKKGEISFDGSSWTTMVPSDGDYNTPLENVSYIYSNLAFGQHNATLRCTDIFNNVGPNVTYQFNAMKGIIVITHDNGNSIAEQDWQDWLNTHSSNASLPWSFDSVHRTDTTSSNFDMTRYVVAIVTDYVTDGNFGSTLVSKLNNFVTSGGIVIVLDVGTTANEQNLGLGTDNGYNTTNTTVVVNNTHYITQQNSIGNLTLYTVPSKIYYLKGYAGKILDTDFISSSDVTLGINNGYITFGTSKPYRFNANGNALTVRILDYAINTSIIGNN